MADSISQIMNTCVAICDGADEVRVQRAFQCFIFVIVVSPDLSSSLINRIDAIIDYRCGRLSSISKSTATFAFDPNRTTGKDRVRVLEANRQSKETPVLQAVYFYPPYTLKVQAQ